MKSTLFTFFLLVLYTAYTAQVVNCPNNSVYFQVGSQIIEQPFPLPASTSVVLSSLPAGASGLTVGPAFNFLAPNPTFWTAAGGTYWYYDGVNWINTTHSTGNTMALNLGGGGTCIYNLVGSTGQVYVYNGTGNGTFLTTVAGFGGGGPFDIGADANDNFYLIKAIAPNPSLVIYNPLGNPVCSYSLANLPAVTGGGGFAIINNVLAVYNNGFSTGNINATSSMITFTPQASTVFPTDFATCVIPVPTGSISAPAGGVIDCQTGTVTLMAEVIPGGIGMAAGVPSSTLASSAYTWTGPGILSGQNTATITVDVPGVYTFSVFSTGCPAQLIVKSFTVNGGATVLFPVITGNTCFSGPTNLSVQGAPGNTYTWSGPLIPGSTTNHTVQVNAAGIYSVTVTNSVGCSGTAVINVNALPSVSVSISANTICALGFNGSPNSLTVAPSGASTYTLLTSSGYSTSAAGPWTISGSGNIFSVQSVTLVGISNGCTANTNINYTVLPNPNITLTPGLTSACFGTAKSFSASGATSYTWLPTVGTNTFSGSVVQTIAAVSSTYSVYGCNQGCYSATQSSSLTVVPLPMVALNPITATICSGNNLVLNSSGTATSFTWTSSAGQNITGNNISINPTSSVIYTLTGALNSCTATSTATITTVTPPNPSLSLSAGTVCAQAVNGSPGSINASVSGAMSYTLLNGSNYNVSGNTIVPNVPAQAGIVAATATLIGSNGFCNVQVVKSFSIFPNPLVVSVPATSIICPGQSKQLTASGATTYSWLNTNAGLDTYTGSIVNATPTLSTIYSVIGESLGCRSVAQVNILNMSAIPTVSASASSHTLCSGSQVSLNAFGTASSYSWMPSVGLSAISGANILAGPSSQQTYTLTGTLNSCTNSVIITLSVTASPLISVSASQSVVCMGKNLSLSAVGANSYSWTPVANLTTVTGQNIIVTPLANTVFSVRGYNGICVGMSTLSVKVLTNPDLHFVSENNKLCEGGVIPLTVNGAQNISWSPATNLSSPNGNMVLASPPVNTNYTITGINSEGTVHCAQQITYLVRVIPNARASVGSNKDMCEGGQTNLRVSGGDTWHWQPSAGLNKTSGNSITARPAKSTIYTVQASYGGECGSSTTLAVNVHRLPTVYAGPDTTVNLDEEIRIRAIGEGVLVWTAGEGIACVTCPETKILPEKNNCYRVVATNEFGCKAEDDVCVTLTHDFYVYIPNSFTPNNDGLNDLFFVVGQGIYNVKMNVYDRWGERVFSSNDQAEGWDGSYRGSDCANGIYTYVISYKGLSGKNFEKAGSVTLLR